MAPKAYPVEKISGVLEAYGKHVTEHPAGNHLLVIHGSHDIDAKTQLGADIAAGVPVSGLPARIGLDAVRLVTAQKGGGWMIVSEHKGQEQG